MFRQGQAQDPSFSSLKEDILKKRLRRLRTSPSMRGLLAENVITINDLIQPIFIEEQATERTAIESLPSVFRETEISAALAAKQIQNLGIPAIMVFGVSHHKDSSGSDSMKKGGLLDRMISRIRDAAPDITIIADTCFCEYTDHGHCGVLDKNGDVDNDRTLENLARQSIIAAQAGADIIAPSGMMDGMVNAIRSALDQNGFENKAILSYAAKYASCFYGPFREAAGCSLGATKGHAIKSDRKTYQMNPANSEEALREVALDIEEGADMVIVKPGLPYLDVLTKIRQRFEIPTFAYHVSGEFAMLKAAAERNWLDYDLALQEQMIAFKRAGATGIVTYGASDMARILGH
jgi:porphobilinogen synthase